MGKWTIAAPIVRHRLVGTPHLSYLACDPEGLDGPPVAIEATRGILVALVISSFMWIGLVALVDRT